MSSFHVPFQYVQLMLTRLLRMSPTLREVEAEVHLMCELEIRRVEKMTDMLTSEQLDNQEAIYTLPKN